MKKIFFLLTFISSSIINAQTVDVFGPQTFDEILSNSFDKAWQPSAHSSIENLHYMVLLDAETQSKAVSLDANNSTIKIIETASVTSTYNSVLRSMFQLVDINSNTTDNLANQYRVVPVLHSYFALNYSSTVDGIITVDMSSYYVSEADESGYLVIDFSGSPSSVIMKASAQWIYNAGSSSLEQNNTWTDQWFTINNDQLALTSDENTATNFFMADSRDLFDNLIDDGSDFDPTSIEWQTNAFADFPEEVWKYEDSDFNDSFLKDVDEDYIDQFGDHESTNTAANTALDEIESTLEASNESLRYTKETYLAFRENLLARTLASTDIYNGRLGERLIQYVYFTNAADNNGINHPFMVIASHNISDSPNFLIDVSRPPGDGSAGGYAEQSITRNAVLGYFLVKIPLKDYGLITNLTDNDLSPYGILADELGTDPSDYDVYNYVGPNSQAIAIDGVVVYPGYNNNLRFAPEDAEITSTGIHVGRGMGLHYHADGHGFNQNGLNLYNYADYEGTNHPPMIGFAYDGILMFGRYEGNYPSMLGFNDPLDEYGGHDHNDVGYHYHAFSKEFEAIGPTGSETISFMQHFFNVGAWKGNINDIPGFLQVTPQQLKDAEVARFAGGPYEGGIGGPSPLSVSSLLKLAIYPNPSHGTFKLVTSENVGQISILNMNGQLIKVVSASQDGEYVISGMKVGIYIIKGEESGVSFTRKIIVR